MDIFIPMGVGFLANMMIYLIIWGITKRKTIAVTSTLASFIILLISSFVIGRWVGMGLGIVSGGMLLASMLFLVINVFSKAKMYFDQDHIGS